VTDTPDAPVHAPLASTARKPEVPAQGRQDVVQDGAGSRYGRRGGGLQFRLEVVVVRDEAGRLLRAGQAEAIKELLSWLHDQQATQPAANNPPPTRPLA
jgi:hypothetical protein